MKVWIVTNAENSPGKILGVFTRGTSAQKYMDNYHEGAMATEWEVQTKAPTQTDTED